MLSEILPKKYQAELVIVGATGLNKLDRFILGSTAAYVVRNTKTDTLVVNE
jgi:nucleotide-binding universal stress UspA family protein